MSGQDQSNSTERHQLVQLMNKYLDLRMGLLGALSMGGIVYWINADHGFTPALIAALKQSTYTFFFGALFVRMAENLAVQFEHRGRAILIGGLIPTLLTAILTYLLHAMKGTPEPFHSTIPTMILGSISFCTWSFLKHRSVYQSGS